MAFVKGIYRGPGKSLVAYPRGRFSYTAVNVGLEVYSNFMWF